MAAPTLVATIPGGVAGTAANWDGPTTLSRVTASFNVTAGDVLVFVGASEDGTQTFNAPTGGSLTWTSQVNIGTANANSRVVIYTATATSTTSMTVTASLVSSNAHWGFRVYQFSDASIGSPASSQAGSTVAPSQAITTAGDNSALVYISADWNATDGSTGGPTPRVWRGTTLAQPGQRRSD
jgi:hypothetical protein